VAQAESNKSAEVERILPRHEFEARMKIEIQRDHKARVTAGWARDLSENGVGAFVGADLIIGETATLTIPFRNKEELVIPAKVTRKVGTEYGFQFTALSPKQRNQIRNVLSESKMIPFVPDSE
jgi:hypothetical protein